MMPQRGGIINVKKMFLKSMKKGYEWVNDITHLR